jgi:[NiFe] hydrogenase assembly HybE family chaperone
VTDTAAELVRHFEHIYIEHMQDLPIVNRHLQVETVGFQDHEGHQLGVLLTPWFMNLVLIPGDEQWRDSAQGDTLSMAFPSGPMDFTVSQDDVLGTYLTAVLFRSVTDMPDQATARAIALEVMKTLFVPAKSRRSLSRRELLTGLRSR